MARRISPRTAVVLCKGGCRANLRTEPACRYGCVGCGRCAEVCPLGAVSVNALGVAEVDAARCIGCGKCVRECPREVLRLHDRANRIVVTCSNRDKGAQARQECAVSCIGCGLCEKNCTAEAIRVRDNCAVIDEARCLSCGMCAVKCPRGAISDLKRIYTD